jgi:phosphate transport system substrate-binding protein
MSARTTPEQRAAIWRIRLGTLVPAVVLSALAVASTGLGQPAFHLALDDYPRVDGSTSAQPLGMLVACRLTRTSFAWRSSMFERTRALAPTAEPYDPARRLSLPLDEAPSPEFDPLIALAPQAQLITRVNHTGTHQSYLRLAAGEVDLVLTAREPTDAERVEAARRGVELTIIPIARDAFVFLRHVTNPVASLTLDQIRDIYAGTVTDWSALRGTAGPIVAYQRNRDSGSQVEMARLVMQGQPMLDGPEITFTASMFGPFNAIRDDPRGIGFSYRYYERYMAPVAEVDTLAIDGVRPEPDTIASGRYPLVTFVYLVHRSDLPDGSPAAQVRDWLTTPAGQAVVAESGYVPLREGRAGSLDPAGAPGLTAAATAPANPPQSPRRRKARTAAVIQ